MADYYINIFMDGDKRKKIEAAGLGDKISAIGGKEAVQVELTAKEQKKLVKGFSGLSFDDANACTLPPEAETKLVDIIADMKQCLRASAGSRRQAAGHHHGHENLGRDEIRHHETLQPACRKSASFSNAIEVAAEPGVLREPPHR
jgi:hypothetical protein